MGGYGRRHLFPYSDVDLLLLFASERLAVEHKEAIAAFLQRLWDAGLRVSHSVRTPAECLEVHDQNIELNVSLLDQRYLAGDRALYAALARRCRASSQPAASRWSRNLAQLARERHAKYANTIYHLEPNVKETPGGLRDYISWLRWLDATLSRIRPAPRPSRAGRRARYFLLALRCFLHREAGRDQYRSCFDAQDALAELWQDADAARLDAPLLPPRARRLPRRHPRLETVRGAIQLAARAVPRLALARFATPISACTASAPTSALRSGSRRGSGSWCCGCSNLWRGTASALRSKPSAADRDACRACAAHFAEPPPRCGPRSKRLLTLPHAALALRAMHEPACSTALFPGTGNAIECLVVRDFYHRYTVDEHTLVRHRKPGALREPRTRRPDALADLTPAADPALLMFALLFHDSGKAAARGGPRGRLGAAGASGHGRASACRRRSARTRALPDPPPPGSFRGHAVARYLRSADAPRPGRSGGDASSA